jgi:hypothetical protein
LGVAQVVVVEPEGSDRLTTYGPVPVVKKPQGFWPAFLTPESKAAP